MSFLWFIAFQNYLQKTKKSHLPEFDKNDNDDEEQEAREADSDEDDEEESSDDEEYDEEEDDDGGGDEEFDDPERNDEMELMAADGLEDREIDFDIDNE